MMQEFFALWPAWLQTCAFVMVAMVCSALISACICRIDLLNSQGKRHKFGWVLCYTSYSACALYMLLSILFEQSLPSKAEIIALLGMCLNILLTRRSWASGPPRIMEKS